MREHVAAIRPLRFLGHRRTDTHGARPLFAASDSFCTHTKEGGRERGSFFRGHLLLNPHERSRKLEIVDRENAYPRISRANYARVSFRRRNLLRFFFSVMVPRHCDPNETIHSSWFAVHYYRLCRNQANYLRIERVQDINELSRDN